MPPLLFFNFFETGRAPLPSLEENARQSAWKKEKTLWKGITFVHYLKDAACAFTPNKEARLKLFHNNAHKLVLLNSKDQQYGKSGHSYGHEYLALASLEEGTHEVHSARMQTEVGDTSESLAMLMVNLILTMGTHRLHNLLKELIDAPEEGSLQELTQQAKFAPTEQEQQVKPHGRSHRR